jgi:hypothetical protein
VILKKYCNIIIKDIQSINKRLTILEQKYNKNNQEMVCLPLEYQGFYDDTED